MFRRSAEMEIELREGMRGGTGTIRIKHLFKQGELTGKARLFAEITIPAGGSIGYHLHEHEEEIYYVLSGRGRVKDEDSVKEVNPGDAILTGGGKGHSVENAGSEPLVLMAAILMFG